VLTLTTISECFLSTLIFGGAITVDIVASILLIAIAAAIDKVLRSRCVTADHRPLAAVGLVAPHAGLPPMQKFGQYRAVGDIAGVATAAWISLVGLSTPKCAFMPKYHWLPFFV
jgi:hypothetical protein